MREEIPGHISISIRGNSNRNSSGKEIPMISQFQGPNSRMNCGLLHVGGTDTEFRGEMLAEMKKRAPRKALSPSREDHPTATLGGSDLALLYRG